MVCSSVTTIEVYGTAYGSVTQCNQRNCYLLEFGGERTRFKVGDFLSFKKKIDRIDLEAMLTDPSPGADYAVVMAVGTGRCFLLSVTEVIALRELLNGAKFMIELNCLIRSCTR